MRKFLGVYYEWGCETKGTYAKMTIDKNAKKILEGYKNYTGSDVKL